MLVQKTNDIADKMGAITFARARPKGAILFSKMGFEVLEKMDVDFSHFGAEGETSFLAMNREPRAKNDADAKLI